MAYNALMKTFLKSLWEKFMEKILLEPMVQKKLGGHFCSPTIYFPKKHANVCLVDDKPGGKIT